MQPSSCSQAPQCKYSENGICMEGNGDNCHYLNQIITLPTKEEGGSLDTETSIPPKSIISLSTGNDMTEEQLSTITYQHQSNLIVLVGEPECGKSTLYASLFDQFHKGAVGNYYYSDSATPIGFEERAHEARLESNNLIPKTPRTKTYEFGYLHLAVRDKHQKKSCQHLLFADVNGERFQNARDRDDAMLALDIFKRASHVIFVVDGELLINSSYKHGVKANFISLVERGLKNKMFPEGRLLHLLITKWDKVISANMEAALDSFFCQQIVQKFDFINSHIFKVASRSQNNHCPAGFGMEDFLNLCLSKPNKKKNEGPSLKPDFESRAFYRFKYQEV